MKKLIISTIFAGLLLILIVNANLCHAGWFPWFSGSGTLESPIPMRAIEVKKITLSKVSLSQDRITGKIYNGSDWYIVSFVAKLYATGTGKTQDCLITPRLKRKSGKLIKRAFKPKSTEYFRADITQNFYLDVDKTRYTYKFVNFKGYKE